MNKKASLFLSAIVIIVALVIGFTIGLKYRGGDNSDYFNSIAEENSQLKEKISQLESQQDEKLKICPEEWINNQQPIVSESNESTSEINEQYFILNKERRELSEFDMNWVIKNCDIKITTVY